MIILWVNIQVRLPPSSNPVFGTTWLRFSSRPLFRTRARNPVGPRPGKQKAFPLPETIALWVFWKSRKFPAFFRCRGQSYARRHWTWNSLNSLMLHEGINHTVIWFLFCNISVSEKRRTFPMARPKCLMGIFTNLYRIYKAHQTYVWWTMKVFRLHCNIYMYMYIMFSKICSSWV